MYTTENSEADRFSIQRLLKLDRRIIFLVLFVALIVTELKRESFKLPIRTSSLVEGIWKPIEDLPERAPVLVALDFDPASAAELDPMSRAALRQIFRNNLRLVSMTHWPSGAQMASQLVQETASEFDDLEVAVIESWSSKEGAAKRIAELLAQQAAGTLPPLAAGAQGTSIVNVGRQTGGTTVPWRPALRDALHGAGIGIVAETVANADRTRHEVLRVMKRTPTLEYGRDYCFLGTKPGAQVLVLAMNQSIPTAFPSDPRTGKPTRDLPVMQGVGSLKDIGYLLTIAAGSSYEWWVVYGSQRVGFPMGIGCTAVMAPDIYPYYGARMVTGLAGGIKGAWEYEALVGTPGAATKAVPAQTIAHCLVIVFVLLCNVAYFASRGGRS